MPTYTQFESFAGTDECEVVLGFDFGTSSSKVVVREPYRTRRAFGVAFGALGHESSGYLLPSTLWLGNEGEASLARLSPGLLLRDIKHHLMRGERVPAIGDKAGRSFDANVVAVAFLALALRESRRWFLETHREVYGQFRLRWSFNLGLPSADFANEGLCGQYNAIAKAAWRLSISDTIVTLPIAARALEGSGQLDELDDLDDDDWAEVRLFPEVAAEVVGYVESTLRTEGLHVLVDIGATTLDVCSFVLHQVDGDFRYELLTADVHELGASMLYRARVAAVDEAVVRHVQNLGDLYDPVRPLPESSEAYAPPRAEVENSLRQGDAAYLSKCGGAIWEPLIRLKTTRDPRSPRWSSRLPLFLAGGGSAMKFYQDLVDGVSLKLATDYAPSQGLHCLGLEKPTNLEADVQGAAYHRVAVACGLSSPDLDLNRISRPTEIEDVTPREIYKSPREFVSKEMV